MNIVKHLILNAECTLTRIFKNGMKRQRKNFLMKSKFTRPVDTLTHNINQSYLMFKLLYLFYQLFWTSIL